VEFRSAQSTHAICGYCQSMVVRNGETLSRIGKIAELFDDHSLLQLQTSGQWNGQAFTLVGRLQYKYGEGTWTEWHALLADGSSAFLSEDNGTYVFTTSAVVQREMPAADQFRVGATTAINGKSFAVASNQQVALIAAQGELQRLPPLGELHAMVELRSQGDTTGGEVLSVDYSTQPPTISMGRAVLLDALKLTGLRDESAKEEKGRQFNCPSCGATLTALLASSKSMTCASCNSIIDLSQGIGGELQHAMQDEPVQPLIPLGTSGTLQGVVWQVVGYQHRMGHAPGDSDEHFGWDEYLLYNARRGFTFLVDSTDGWSVVSPATGAPVVSNNGKTARYLGKDYRLKETYLAETNYVVGEFYWRVQRGQQTSNSDFVTANGGVLSMEQSPQELTWSVGNAINSELVAKAFGLQDKKDLLKRDVAPFSAAPSIGIGTIIVLVLVLLLLSLLLSRCSSCNPQVENCSSGYRSSGGSYGGYSGGGGHK
jgi:hypothetical protein